MSFFIDKAKPRPKFFSFVSENGQNSSMVGDFIIFCTEIDIDKLQPRDFDAVVWQNDYMEQNNKKTMFIASRGRLNAYWVTDPWMRKHAQWIHALEHSRNAQNVSWTVLHVDQLVNSLFVN